MKHSVMMFPFHAALANGTLTPEDVVRQFKEHGAVAIETMHGLEVSAPAAFEGLIAAAKKENLAIACHDIGINLIGPEATREEQFKKVCAQLDFTRNVLNCDTVLLYANKQEDGVSPQEGRKLYAQALTKAGEYAQKLGITVTIEDFDPTPDLACRAEDCREILTLAAPLPKQTFDIGNFMMTVNQKPVDAYAILKDFIAHVHVKDIIYNPELKKNTAGIIGDGVAQIPEIYNLLRNDGYKGYLSIEIASRELQHALDALDYLAAL